MDMDGAGSLPKVLLLDGFCSSPQIEINLRRNIVCLADSFDGEEEHTEKGVFRCRADDGYPFVFVGHDGYRVPCSDGNL